MVCIGSYYGIFTAWPRPEILTGADGVGRWVGPINCNHPRMLRGNAFGHVCLSVCLCLCRPMSVCLSRSGFNFWMFDRLDLETSFSRSRMCACRYGHMTLLVCPWPWPDDLDIRTWLRYSDGASHGLGAKPPAKCRLAHPLWNKVVKYQWVLCVELF